MILEKWGPVSEYWIQGCGLMVGYHQMWWLQTLFGTFLTPVWVKLWTWFFQCIANRYCQVNWWSKFLIQPMHLSVIDPKKCPKSPHTSWGDFGHTYFTPLILLAQSGLFIYITLTLEIIIANWSNLSTIILTLHKKWSFPLRISFILLSFFLYIVNPNSFC